MTEKEKLISHILDLKEKAAADSIITFSNFLSIDELSYVHKAEKRVNQQYVNTFYFGGYSEAERKIAVFIPSFYKFCEDEIEDFLEKEASYPIKLLRVNKDAFSQLSHRDYLGALMGLGLKREMIGDILSDENGCYIFCLKTVSEYIIENLKQAGRGQLSVSQIKTSLLNTCNIKTEEIFISVASMRLDCLVSAVFHLSRSSADEAIKQGIVYVNSEQVLKSNFILKPSDKLVLRGKGKAVVNGVIGESKKGRLHINIKRYL